MKGMSCLRSARAKGVYVWSKSSRALLVAATLTVNDVVLGLCRSQALARVVQAGS